MNTSSFFDHPMNRLMLKGSVMPQFNMQELALKYIGLAKSGQQPADSQVQAVRKGLEDYCESIRSGAELEADIAGIRQVWPEMERRFRGSLGLTQMMLDGGVKSRYFYPYLLNTGRYYYAPALEIKDGRGMPISGEPVFDAIPETDWACMVAAIEPVHVAKRCMEWLVQDLLRKAKTIFDGGAGMLSVYRNYGYPLGEIGQKIVACDVNAKMPDFLSMVLPKSLEEYGVEYIIGDLLTVMSNPEHFGRYDVVRLAGLVSYFPNFEDRVLIIEKALRLLADGGVLIADWWTMGMSLARSGLIGIWPNMPDSSCRLVPSDNPVVAINEVEMICDRLGVPFVSVVDFANGKFYTQANTVPKGVLFLIGQGVSTSMLNPVPEII